MSVTARIYIALIIAAGAATVGYACIEWSPRDLPRFYCYLALAIPASCLKVRLPKVTGTMSVLFLFLLAGIVELSLAETLIIGGISVLVQSFWRARVRPRAIQVLFSLADIAIATGATYYVYHWDPLPFGYAQGPFRLAAAASVFFVTNTFPIAVVVSLTEKKSLRKVWAECYCWSFPNYLVGAAIVGVFRFADRLLDWQAWLMILPVVYVIFRSYRLYLDRLEAECRHAEEVGALHAHTMDALASAMTANAKLDTVIRASPLAIVAVDQSGSVTTWNAAAETIFGWTADEVLGRPLPFPVVNSAEAMLGVVDATLHGELISGIEVTHPRKDGSSFAAAIWTALLRDSEQRISGVLVKVADVSDRKRLEEQLRLSQKMEAVGRLAGGIAHDFNNLLTIINGYSGMLMEELKDNPYGAAQAEEIFNAGNRAADLVSKLLTFSRRQAIRPELLEINQLVQDIGQMLRRLVGEHVQIRSILDPEAGWILADANQMEAALMNLATNARDAMPDGGLLSIETSPVEVVADRQPPEVDLPDGSYVRLVVKDTGHGMDAETQRHLFEPFFTTKKIGKGTGLGLSSVYGGVDQNKGRIFVASEVGRGTTFSIYLPRFERPEALASSDPTSHKVIPGNEIILLVEDEVPVRRMLREALAKVGYRVWEAGNGAEALEYWGAEVEAIDLLVTDVIMPVMNGLRLAEELRTRLPGLKVVFMSGHCPETVAKQGLDPAVDFLPKPFVPAALVRKVRELLDQPRSSARYAAAP